MGYLSSLLRGVNRKDTEKLNILCVNEYELFQSAISHTDHNFYFMNHPNLRPWNEHIEVVPQNCLLLNGKEPHEQLKLDMAFDLVLCQNRMSHYPLLSQLVRMFGCPIISVDHELSLPSMDPNLKMNLSDQPYNFRIFGSEFLANSWGFSGDDDNVSVIEHGIDTDVFNGWEGGSEKVLTMVDSYSQCDESTGFSIWQSLSANAPMQPIGNTPGLSKLPKDRSERISLYKKASVFLNTSLWQNCPIYMLEAMSVGCPIVTTATTTIPDFIQHEINGLMSNDKEELLGHINRLLTDREFAKTLGECARRTIIEKFGINKFVDQWDKTLTKCVDKTLCLLTQ